MTEREELEKLFCEERIVVPDWAALERLINRILGWKHGVQVCELCGAVVSDRGCTDLKGESEKGG